MIWGVLAFIGILLEVFISVFVTGKRRQSMGVIIFLVLCLNVIGTMCGGNSNWGEQYEEILEIYQMAYDAQGKSAR